MSYGGILNSVLGRVDRECQIPFARNVATLCQARALARKVIGRPKSNAGQQTQNKDNYPDHFKTLQS